MGGRLHDDEGSVTAFVVVVMVGLLAVVGMVYDGGQLIAARAEATDVAEAAVRVGAQHVDLDQLRRAEAARLDAPAATAAAQAAVAATGHRGSATVAAGRLVVTVTVDQPMRLLPLGVQQVSVTVRSAPVAGIDEGRMRP